MDTQYFNEAQNLSNIFPAQMNLEEDAAVRPIGNAPKTFDAVRDSINRLRRTCFFFNIGALILGFCVGFYVAMR